jgi:hypothetical protein
VKSRLNNISDYVTPFLVDQESDKICFMVNYNPRIFPRTFIDRFEFLTKIPSSLKVHQSLYKQIENQLTGQLKLDSKGKVAYELDISYQIAYFFSGDKIAPNKKINKGLNEVTKYMTYFFKRISSYKNSSILYENFYWSSKIAREFYQNQSYTADDVLMEDASRANTWFLFAKKFNLSILSNNTDICNIEKIADTMIISPVVKLYLFVVVKVTLI